MLVYAVIYYWMRVASTLVIEAGDELTSPNMHSHVHLVVVFTFSTKSLNKSRLREGTRNAEDEYKKLLRLLESSGLKVVGKAGRRHGEIIVLVHSPSAKLDQLAKLEQ